MTDGRYAYVNHHSVHLQFRFLVAKAPNSLN
jgi:hypothetical protein